MTHFITIIKSHDLRFSIEFLFTLVPAIKVAQNDELRPMYMHFDLFGFGPIKDILKK